MTDDIWSDRFDWCVLAAGFMAVCEGLLDDSAYVKRLAYQWYEEGTFMEEAKARKSAQVTGRFRPTDLIAERL
jgi:hypothetical protein